MIDTIILKFIRSEYPDIESYNSDYNRLKCSINLLKDIIYNKEHRNGASEQFEKKEWDLLLRGYDNYFILSISLWKFCKGNNLVPFEMFEVREALKKLSALLDVRIEKGLLQRVDIAQNFEMDRPVGLYIKAIQRPRGMEYFADYTRKTVGFCNRSRNQQIVLYDKIALAKKQGFSFFEFPQNLLRYEFRFKRQLRNSVNWAGNKAKIKGVYLYSTAFLNFLVHRWHEGFCKIDLPYEPNGVGLTGTAQYKNFLIAIGIGAIGLTNCYRHIDMIANDDGKPMSNSSKSKLRKDLRELTMDRNISQPSPLIRELRRKVAERFKTILKHQNLTIVLGDDNSIRH